MIKTLAAANKSEREPFKIPRSVQQSIPIQRVFRDGIWQTGRSRYSRTWRFADINYSVASHEDQQEMFLAYCGVLNSLPTGATAKITINNRRLNGTDFQHSVLMRLKGDELDRYRQEYNGILTEKALESNNLIQDKYITISVARKNIDEARTFFKRVDIDLSKSFGKLDSGAKPLDNHERLRIFHDFFRPSEERDFQFDLSAAMRRGHHFKDAIAPDGMQFKADHFELGGKVGRVLFLREYASYIKDRMITDLSDFSRNLMLSIDILPIPTNHDSPGSVGYRFTAPNGRSACLVTDLGLVTSQVESAVRGVDLAVIECNHDIDALQNGPYPYYLKSRIAGPQGHLSNEDGAGLCALCAQEGAHTVVLAHLSRENNTPALARSAVTRALEGLPPVRLEVAPVLCDGLTMEV